jgi:hypothetical protein
MLVLVAPPHPKGIVALMSDLTRRRWAAAALAGTGLIHLVLAPEYAGEQAYVGVLFVLGAIACAIAALRVWRTGDLPGWALGALTCAGMFAGFVLSRTVGLPGFKEADWELSGLISLVLEAGVVVAALSAVRRAPARRVAYTAGSVG